MKWRFAFFSFLFLFYFLVAVFFDFLFVYSAHQCTIQQLFQHIFIKNGSHGTIHTFKNYFATVFSVFSFQLYPNGPWLDLGFQVAPNGEA